MKSYFYTLIITSVVGSVCAMLTSGGFEKYVKYIVSLVCAVMILFPLKDTLYSVGTELPSGIVLEEETCENGLYSAAAEMTVQKTEAYISDAVFSEFGIKPLYSIINIDWDAEEPTVESIKTALSQEDMLHADEVSEYLKGILGGEVEIIEG